MRPLLAISSLLLLVLTVGSTAQPPKEGKKPSNYFPTTVGTEWVYEEESEEDFTETLRITAVAEKGGAKVVTLTEKVVRLDPETKKKVAVGEYTKAVLVSGEGVFRTAYGNEQYDPPDPLLKLPHVAGAKWEWRDKAGKYTARYKALEPEEVKVPAGTFKAIPVERVFTQKGVNIGLEHTEWYAPGVGVVKRKDSINFSGGHTFVLRSFTAGKD